jgi:flagellar motor switch protein FliN/FliY
VTTDQALEQLARSSAEAVVGALEMFGGADGAIALTGVRVLSGGEDPLAGLPAPGVAAAVAYVEGVTGGNVLAIGVRGARRLANAMMGMDPAADVDDEPLSELELSAVSEAANQTMAAAGQATAAVIGEEVDISPPETRAFATTDGVVEVANSADHVTSAALSLFGEPARLVQVVPTAFTVRMTRALDRKSQELDVEPPAGAADPHAGERADPAVSGVAPALGGTGVRLWAELGRARMPIAQAVSMPTGGIVELDREPDELIDLYVNGRRLALGRLVITDGGRWAVRVEQVLDSAAAPTNRDQKGVSPRWLEYSS